jgi:hypothetical protein
VECIGIVVYEFLNRFVVARRGLSAPVEREREQGTALLDRVEDMVLRVQQDTVRKRTYKDAV